MVASRWFWAVTLGSLLAISAVAVPAAGWFVGGHSPFGPSQGRSAQPTSPGWHNETGNRYAVTFAETGLPAGTNWTVSVWRSGGHAPGPGGIPAAAAPAWGWVSTNTTSNATIGFELFNGSYAFSVQNATNGSGVYVPSPSAGQFLVNGSAASVSVSFATEPMFELSFTETGLPSGTFWSVVLSGAFGGYGGYGGHGGYGGLSPALVRGGCGTTTENGSNQTTVSFLVPNGTYDFFVGNVSTAGALYVPTPASGNVSVNGSGESVSIAFAAVPLYPLTFTESGLPSGTWWSVALWSDGNGSFFWNATNTSSITFWVANGTFNFSVSNTSSLGAYYVASPSFGNVTISGAPATVPVTYTTLPLYSVTFEETGLPNGTWWSAVLSGPNCTWLWNGTNTTNVTFWVENGSYNFSIGDVWTPAGLYAPSPSNGSVEVAGAAVVVPVVFAGQPVYNVSFVETGLPSGANWSVALFAPVGPCAAPACGAGHMAPAWGGLQYNSSNSTTVNFSLTDGLYYYFVSVVCNNSTVYLPTPGAGNVTVNGTAVTVSITFAPLVLTTVTVNETGLPNGTVWFVALESGNTSWSFGVSNNTSVTFVLPSGTYGLDIGPVWVGGVLYTPVPATDYITVDGTAVTVDVTFTASSG